MNTAVDRFNAERRTGIGGSDVAVVLGLSPWKTPFELWMEKTGRAVEESDSLPLRFGTFAEEFVAQEYERETGLKTRRFNAMLRHPSAPLVGHVDRLVVPAGANVASGKGGKILATRGLECKTVNAFALGRGSQWGDEYTDHAPSYYLVQCAVYMALTGLEEWDLAALFGGSQALRIYHLTRNPELEEVILAESTAWWERHVVADTPPDPVAEHEARMRWSRHIDGKVLALDADTAQALAQYATIKRELKSLEDEAQRLRDVIVPAIGDADTLTFDGVPLATFRANKDGRKTDWKAVAEEMQPSQEVIDRHTTTVPGPRVLRLGKELTK